MKTYIAKFWRGNPQLSNGGYETTIRIEAITKSAAKKKAMKYEKDCVYGIMTLIEIREEKSL